jgi:hypothetical protein
VLRPNLLPSLSHHSHPLIDALLLLGRPSRTIFLEFDGKSQIVLVIERRLLYFLEMANSVLLTGLVHEVANVGQKCRYFCLMPAVLANEFD